MSLKYVSNRVIQNNDRLSLSRNLTRQTVKLEIKSPTATTNATKLKSVLLVYVSDDNRTFVDKSAAYSLGLTDVRAIMLENKLNLFEVSDLQIEQFKQKNFEIEYRKILNNEAPKKPTIKVFNDGVDYFIEPSAAYALGLITVENFNNMSDQLYKVSDNLLMFLNNKYAVETINMAETEKHR